jgi:hypothetical protein
MADDPSPIVRVLSASSPLSEATLSSPSAWRPLTYGMILLHAFRIFSSGVIER